MNMVDYVRKFCESYGYTEEEKNQCVQVCAAVLNHSGAAEKWLRALALLFGEEEVRPAEYLDILKEVAGDIGVNVYIVPLVFYIYASAHLQELYDEIQLPEWVRRNTLVDLAFKIVECKMMTGCVGLYTPQWFYGYFKVRRFGLGRMQYDIWIHDGEDIEVGGRRVQKGDAVLRCHIPRCKQNFGRSERLESYKLAYLFVKERYPELFKEKEVPFTCTSWLLFPLHEDILSQESNIVGFMKEFKIYKVSYYTSASETWRIFGRPYQNNPEEMPAENSLQAGYKQWLLAGNQTGFGYGAMLFDGEKIIR